MGFKFGAERKLARLCKEARQILKPVPYATCLRTQNFRVCDLIIISLPQSRFPNTYTTYLSHRPLLGGLGTDQLAYDTLMTPLESSPELGICKHVSSCHSCGTRRARRIASLCLEISAEPCLSYCQCDERKWTIDIGLSLVTEYGRNMVTNLLVAQLDIHVPSAPIPLINPWTPNLNTKHNSYGFCDIHWWDCPQAAAGGRGRATQLSLLELQWTEKFYKLGIPDIH